MKQWKLKVGDSWITFSNRKIEVNSIAVRPEDNMVIVVSKIVGDLLIDGNNNRYHHNTDPYMFYCVEEISKVIPEIPYHNNYKQRF